MGIVIALPACLIPSIVLYLWLKRRCRDKPGYAAGCRMSLICGVIAAAPVVASAAVLEILWTLTGLQKSGSLLFAAYQSLLQFALAEELFKFLMFRRVLRKTECDYSWYDATVFMTLVGVGFGILESVIYSFSMSPVLAIVRGLTLMHGAFGFIMGYFYGKALKTGRKRCLALSFLLPCLFHGAYDFTLSPELEELSDAFSIIPVFLAFLSIVVLIILIVFFARRKRDEKYTAPLRSVADHSAADLQQERKEG